LAPPNPSSAKFLTIRKFFKNSNISLKFCENVGAFGSISIIIGAKDVDVYEYFPKVANIFWGKIVVDFEFVSVQNIARFVDLEKY